MIDLNGLNPQQRLAAETITGPVLILAGAGSGKTRTLTYRIGHMIDNLRIPPKDILAVSFTNKAAMEMHERVTKLLGTRKKRGITLSTYHSLGIKILREDIHHIGYNRDFTIYDQGDQMAIVREGLTKIKLDKTSFDKKTIMSKIGRLKNAGISADEFRDTEFYDPEDPYDEATEYVYHFYQDKLQFYNAVDFDDILFLCVRLFAARPDIAAKYSARYKYIMIDEYQDTNSLQFDMVRALTSTHNNICVVGDDDQSIYAFRGADITNILNFERLYENTTVIKLEQNYRSTDKILNLANVVIKDNIKRKDKTMRTDIRNGITPMLWAAANGDHEAQIIIDEIIEIQKKGLFLGDVAILYRSNMQVPPVEDQLRLSQIPYTIIGGQKFYEKKEIKDLIAYLSVIFNPKDELSLRRILNIPNRGIGTVTLKKYLEAAEKRSITLFEVIQEECLTDESKRGKSLQDFMAIIKKYKWLFTTMTLTQALAALINEIHYYDFIDKSYDSPKIASRKRDDVKNFLLSTDRFVDRFAEEATLDKFLERLLLVDNQDKKNDDSDVMKNEVQLMTLHSSKGLEFDTCFVLGMEEELLPHKNVIKENGDIDEERRLCYVGITRAKRRLIMTYAKERKIYGKAMRRCMSRFLVDHTDHFTEQDRNSFSHLTDEEEQDYKSNFFNDLLSSLDD
jgi:superfamily I DNA/RNA helicase